MFVPKDTFKFITYAYPTSIQAKNFGYEEEGCYYIQYQNGQNTWADTQVGAFVELCEDLINSFKECEGKEVLNKYDPISIHNAKIFNKTKILGKV